MKGIIPLASYPKSGNTWLRIILSSVMGGGVPVDIAEIEARSHIANRSLYDERIGVETSELTPEELELLRGPALAEFWWQENEKLFVKTHDAFLVPPGGGLIPLPLTAIPGAVYVVRDPRDVAVSFAHHSGQTLDLSIADMADEACTLADKAGRLGSQLPQFVSSWSRHVESWLDGPDFPVLLLRYEDMIADPVAAFGSVCRFVGLDASSDLLDRAIAAGDFKTLQAQETKKGFAERPLAAESFFRRGEAGGWRDSLTPNQAARIVADHGRAMARLGYL